MGTTTLEALYQDIGRMAFEAAEGPVDQLLLYAEVEDGVFSADLFYRISSHSVRFRYCSTQMVEAVYALWQTWKTSPGNREWRAMSYAIDNGKFSMDLKYPDQMIPGEDVSERRPLAVKRHFGDANVDYSRP